MPRPHERGVSAFFDSLGAAVLDRLEAELGNIRAAFTWLEATGDATTTLRLAVALGSFWHVRGHVGEGQDRLERALALAVEATPGLRAKALYWLGQLSVHGFNDPRGFTWLEENLALHHQIGDHAGAIATTILLGGAAEYRGNDDQAMDYYGRALDLSRELGESRLIIWSLVNLADGAYRQGPGATSASYAGEALSLADASGDHIFRVFALIVSIQAALDQRDLPLANRLATDCLVTCRSSGNRLGFVAALVGLAAVQLAQGQTDRTSRLPLCQLHGT